MDSVLGVSEVLSHNGPVAVGDIKADFVMLYFSASWCPPCKMFTPKLAEFYTKNKENKKFEIIFISSDRDEASFKAYFDHHPWLAIHGAAAQKVGAKFGVSGIPALYVLDKNGQLVTKDGRAGVMTDPEAASFPWA